MVDLHTHILPGVDDGAESFDVALEMLQQAHESGTTDVVLTPHYLTRDVRSSGASKQHIIDTFNELKVKASSKLPKLNLHLGSETFAAANISDYLERDLMLPLGNSKNLLVEFGFDDSINRVLEITKLIISAGYTVVVAHPERYRFLLYNPQALLKLLDQGVLLQINASSVMGQNGAYSRDMALSLIDSGLAAVIASDCHSVSFRNPDLSECYSFVSSEFSVECADALLSTNPLAVINGDILM